MNSAGSSLRNGVAVCSLSEPVLIRTTPEGFDVPSFMRVGELNAAPGNEMVLGARTATTGRVTCYDIDGNVLWTYSTPTNDVCFEQDIGDVDEDGDNEVAIGFGGGSDNIGVLLDHNGNLLWSYDAGVNKLRAATIGKLRSDYAGKQVVYAGNQGTLALLDKNGNIIWNKNGATAICAPSCSGGTRVDTVQGADIGDTDLDGQNEILIGYGEYTRKYDHNGNLVWSALVGGDGESFAMIVRVGKFTQNTGLQVAAAVAGIGTGGQHGEPPIGTINRLVMLDKDGNFLWDWWPPIEPAGCFNITAADVNGDGLDECIVSWGYTEAAIPNPDTDFGGITVLDSEGVAIAARIMPNTMGSSQYVDVDNDGELEIVATCNDGNVYAFDIC